mmetsp:Transcript_3161/g.12105  ORF Transcript_3161/g.12105 Transcript_3161/m.12105 type:complete len:462 (-) Transcript_3161:2372-3757(-)
MSSEPTNDRVSANGPSNESHLEEHHPAIANSPDQVANAPSHASRNESLQYGPQMHSSMQGTHDSDNSSPQASMDAQQLAAAYIRYFQMQQMSGPHGFHGFHAAMMGHQQGNEDSMSDDDRTPYADTRDWRSSGGSNFFSRWQPKKLEPWKEPTTLEEKRELYGCGDHFVQCEDLTIWPEYFAHQKLKIPQEKSEYTANNELNQKIVLWKGDSTCLECDAIVNAANSSLLGGGGIDGAIHGAAGGHLREECMKLDGCSTGETKITKGYRLPAKHVLHTVGPTREDPVMLASCYQTCLDVAKANGVRTLAFCCISTGIYGYPLRKATHVALKTVREWLENEDNANSIDRLIFVVFKFDTKEERVYKRYLPRYFPLSNYAEETEVQSDTDDETPVMRYSNFSWASWESSSDEEYNTDSGDEKYFEEYFKHHRHPMGDGFEDPDDCEDSPKGTDDQEDESDPDTP